MVFYFICLNHTLPEFSVWIDTQLDTAVFASQDRELTLQVLAYLNAMQRTTRILGSMAINMLTENLIRVQVDALFVICEADKMPPQCAGHLLNIIHIEGLLNGESSIERQQEYHNAHFNHNDLQVIRAVLGEAII